MTTADAIVLLVDAIWLFVLAAIPVALTVAMFLSRNRMLGWPSAGFWMVFGGYCYLKSDHTWTDIYYYLFFLAFVGMVLFCALGQYGLREVKDSEADEGKHNELEPEDPAQGEFGDEGKDDDGDGFESSDSGRRRQRRSTKRGKINWGAFR